MPYDPMMVQPMREELTAVGVKELTTPEEVEKFMQETDGTAMIVVNSVCGCAAGSARPAVRLALEHANKPQRVATVFAGQDTEATQKARTFFAEFPPSSPSFVLFKDGKAVHYTPRHAIEARDPQSVAGELTKVFDQYCAASAEA